MRNLLNFILKYSTWFVFAFYVLLGCILLFSGRGYRQAVWLTSANSMATGINGMGRDISGYFHLRSENKSLQERTAALETDVLNLREQIKMYQAMLGDSVKGLMPSTPQRFDYVLATVLNNSTHRNRNYFTINRGTADGVEPGMGVVDHNGVVGIVNVSSKHASRVISVLNKLQKISVKIKGTPYVGILGWYGTDPEVAYMQELPQHVTYHVGDTVVTSGNSTSFPADLMIGTVMSAVRGADDNYYTLKVKLSSDFDRLSAVRVIKDYYKVPLDTLSNYDLTE